MDQNQMNMEKGEKGMVCKCPHHKMVPAIIVLVGAVLIISAWWPTVIDETLRIGLLGILLVVIGGTKMFSHKCTCCSKPWR